MLLGTLGASLLGNILVGKGINRAGEGAITKSISDETKSNRQVEVKKQQQVRETTTKN